MTLAQARIQKVKLYENILNNKSTHFNNLNLTKAFTNKNDVSQRYKDQMISLMNRFILVKIGHLPPNKITRKDIVNCLSPIISSGKKANAKMALVALNMLFKYCVLNEYTEHNIIADIDKKTLIGKISVKHYSYFNTDEKVSNLLKSIKSYLGNEKTKICALLQLYTAVRGKNAREARWCEFDFKNSIWNIPASKMKTKRPHTVYLSQSVKNMLLEYKAQSNIENETDYLFKSDKSSKGHILPIAINNMLHSLGFSGDDITPHGFRATFSTIAHEMREVHAQSSDIIEMCLAHVEANKVKEAYNHAKNLKARSALMQWWSDYLDTLG